MNKSDRKRKYHTDDTLHVKSKKMIQIHFLPNRNRLRFVENKFMLLRGKAGEERDKLRVSD